MMANKEDNQENVGVFDEKIDPKNAAINDFKDVIHVKDYFAMKRSNPEREIFCCYSENPVHNLELGEKLFKMPNDVGTQYKFFFLSLKEVPGYYCVKKKLNEIDLRPRLLKTSFPSYGSDLVIKVNLSDVEDPTEKLDSVIENGFYFCDGKIKIAKLEGRDIYFILFSDVRSFINIEEEFRAKRLNYNVYMEYKFRQNIKGKVFVKKGFKPYLYEYIYDHKGAIAIIDEDEFIYTNLFSENGNRLYFRDVYDFLELSLDSKNSSVLSTNIGNINFSVDINVIKDKAFHATYEELKEKKRALEKELRLIERQMRKLSEKSNRSAGLFVREDELNDLYYYMNLYHGDEMDKVSVFQFLTEKENEEGEKTGLIVRHYFLYGPENLLPLNVFTPFVESPTWSTSELKVLIRKDYRIIPDIEVEKIPTLFDKFLNTLLKTDEERKKAKNGEYFLLLDDSSKFFPKVAVFVEKAKGMKLSEFTRRYAEFRLPVKVQKDGTQDNESEDYYSINSTNMMKKQDYFLKLEKDVTDFFDSLVQNVQEESNRAMEEWAKALDNIKILYNQLMELLGIFRNDVQAVRSQLNGYFSDTSILDNLARTYDNIRAFHEKYGKKFEDPKIKKIMTDDYNTFISKYENLISSFKDLNNEVQSKQKSYESEFNDIYKKIDDLVKQLEDYNKKYINLEGELIQRMRKADENARK